MVNITPYLSDNLWDKSMKLSLSKKDFRPLFSYAKRKMDWGIHLRATRVFLIRTGRVESGWLTLWYWFRG